jgi:hypothetical protein
MASRAPRPGTGGHNGCFRLDQSFPQPIFSALSEFVVAARVGALADIDGRRTTTNAPRPSSAAAGGSDRERVRLSYAPVASA